MKPEIVAIPSALISSAEYGCLSEVQRQNFDARLRYCLELAGAARVASQVDDEGLAEALDDIELDALSINGAFGVDEKSISIYQVHSSWTFETSAAEMSASVDHSAVDFIENRQAKISDSASVLKEWLADLAMTVEALLIAFSESSTYSQAIGRLIMIDALVGRVTTVAVLSRFNKNFR